MSETKPFDDRVQEKMQEYLPFLEGSDGLQRKLIENILLDYCRIDVQLDEVNAQVREVGYNIVNKQGNVVRNPDVMTQHQLINEKNALLPKILKFASADSKAQTDELMDFLRG